MKITQCLDQLPRKIQQAIHPDFIFLVYPNKVQHFPIRQWSKDQVKGKLQEYLGSDYQLTTWQNFLVAYNEKIPLIAVIPGFTDLN